MAQLGGADPRTVIARPPKLVNIVIEGTAAKNGTLDPEASGVLVVCLVPARTDTAWWHDYATKGQVTFIRGRLKFGGHVNSAPFPSATVVFLPNA